MTASSPTYPVAARPTAMRTRVPTISCFAVTAAGLVVAIACDRDGRTISRCYCEHERLATSDRGVVMYRQMLFREMERVQRGEDPMCVIRDPDHAIIDTNLQGTLELGGSVPEAFRQPAGTAPNRA